MTTPSSCKSFFKPYLLYKLRAQFVPFIISALFNLLTLPLLAVEVGSSYWGIGVPSLGDMLEKTLYFCALAVFLMSITGAARAFNTCVKRDETDTFGALPLTRREHFTADLLSGYIANVGPFFPCAIFAMIMSLFVDKGFNDNLISWGEESADGIVIEWFALMVLALFLLYTFSYITSAFVTVCCGKMSSSIIFTFVVSGLIMIAGAGIGTYAEQCATGLSVDNYYYLAFIPPLGFLDMAREAFNIMGSLDLSRLSHFPVPPLWAILLIIAAGAAVVYASYRIFKNRRAERTGKVISSNVIYRTICTLSVIAVTSVSLSAAYSLHAVWIPLLIAFGITAVLILVLEAIRGFKKAGLVITGARGLITMAVCVIALVIVDKTGAFGARYIGISPENIKEISVYCQESGCYRDYDGYNISTYNGHLKFTEQSDISEFLKRHNATLKSRSNELSFGSTFSVSIRLKNGDYLNRGYRANYHQLFADDPENVIDELNNNLTYLPNFKTKKSENYADVLKDSENIKVQSLGIFGEADIPPEKCAEFYDLFTREFSEKYDPSDETAGAIMFEYDDRKYLRRIDIPSSCTETLKFAEEFRQNDTERLAFSIYAVINGMDVRYAVTVKEAESELGRELISLLSSDGRSGFYKSSFYTSVYSTDMNSYCIHSEDLPRVLDIITQLIENKYLAESPQ